MTNKLKFSFLILITVLLTTACSKDKPRVNSNGTVIKLNPIWDFPLKSSSQPYSLGNMRINAANDRVVCIPSVDDTQNYLTGVDVWTGEKIWEWRDIFRPDEEYINARSSIVINDQIIFYGNEDGFPHYSVNLETGHTIWKTAHHDLSFGQLQSDEKSKYYFVSGARDSLSEYRTGYIFEGDVSNGNSTEFLFPDLTQEIQIGNRISSISMSTRLERNNSIYFFCIQSHPGENWTYNSMIGLYNRSTSQWKYSNLEISSFAFSNIPRQPVIIDDKVLVGNNSVLYAFDLWTGEEIWKQEGFDGAFHSSGFKYSNGVLTVNCRSDKMYGIDVHSGDIMWFVPNGGDLESHMIIENDIVYWITAGFDRYLQAVDIHTGKLVWQLDASLIEGSGSQFDPSTMLSIVPGRNGQKGRVVAATNDYAYCFEAYR